MARSGGGYKCEPPVWTWNAARAQPMGRVAKALHGEEWRVYKCEPQVWMRIAVRAQPVVREAKALHGEEQWGVQV